MQEQLVRLFNEPCGSSPCLDQVMEVLDEGRLLYLFLTSVAVALLLTSRDTTEQRAWLTDGTAALLALLGSLVVSRLLAAALPVEPRPLAVLPDLHTPHGWTAEQMLGDRPNTSVPSSHAVLGSAVGLCLIWLRPRWGVLLLLGGLVMTVPPVLYFGLHWPSDVAVALLISTAVGWLASRARPWLVRPASWMGTLLQRQPVLSYGIILAVAAVLVRRGGPRTGIVRALTDYLRGLLHGPSG